MPDRKRKVWVRLTVLQIDALLAAARVIDVNPEALAAVLPDASDRFAFRAAISTLQNVRGAMDTTE